MTTQITALPTPPSRQRPLEFSSEADSFLGALPTFAVEANALASEVNSNTVLVSGLAANIQTELNTATANATSAAAASANNAAQSAALAQASEQKAEQYANAAQGASNYTGDWSADRTYSKGQTVSYDRYVYVSKIDGNLNQIPNVSKPAWFEIKTEADLFRQPVAISPTTGSSGVLPNTTLSATSFAALYSVDTRVHRRFEVALLSDSNFTSPVFTTQVNADSVAITPNLTLTTAYHWRCKDVATTGESVWMLANSFVTGNISISAPTVTVTGSPSAVPESPTITTSAFTTVPAGEDTHLSTDYEVRKTSDNSLVWSSYNNTTDKLSITIPAGVLAVNTSYKFRARHNGSNFGSSVYGEVTATTVASFFDVAGDVDGLTSLVTIQQEWNPATTYAAGAVVIIRYGDTRFVEYKSLTSGNINNNPVSSPTHWQQVYDNNLTTSGYFGEVLGNKCVVDKGEWLSTTAYSIGDMVVVKNVATPLKQSDLTAYVAKTANTNKPPASNPANWEQRNALPTGTSLAQTLGIGNTTPEVLINNNSGWLKFVHQGKIKYVAKKPFMHTVSWNDIAKAEAVYGNRTVRIGSRLYRVSLLSGAEADPSSWTTSSTATDNKGTGSEWNELVYRVHNTVPTDGTATSHGGKQVGSNWWNFTDADMVMSGTGNGSYTWCKETLSSNTAYRVLRGGDLLSDFSRDTSSTTNTNYGWRPCLTLISEPEADSKLYNSTSTGVGPSVASLQYDPITDTGYYGEVTSAQFYTGTQISTATAVTSGTLQNDTEGWLKFYWHGQVLFIAKKTYRHSISWDNINTANAIYGVNLGSTSRKTITHSGSSTSYDVKLMKGGTKDPSPADSPGRQWNELLYRVCTGTETGEIGNNWATLNPVTDLGINSGNGSYSLCQEVYQPDTASRVIRGGVSLSHFSYRTSSNTATDIGWRPCLSYVRP